MIDGASSPGTPPGFYWMVLGQLPVKLPDAIMLTFDVTTSNAADFERYGVVCPVSLQRSVPKRRAEYLAGRRVALASLREQGAVVLDLGIGEAGAPVWPPGFIGSITHADGIAGAVAMPSRLARGIGIDIERIAGADAVEAIRETVVSATECTRLAAIADTSGWPFALTLAFSAKESFYKATAATVGRIFDFSVLRILGGEYCQGWLEAEITEELAPTLRAGMRFTLCFRSIDDATLITSCAWAQ